MDACADLTNSGLWEMRRVGVLVVYAPRAPIFADDDLALVQLLANQIGGFSKVVG